LPREKSLRNHCHMCISLMLMNWFVLMRIVQLDKTSVAQWKGIAYPIHAPVLWFTSRMPIRSIVWE